jgi:Trk K+ transport system NAD-binding subunit
MSETQFKTSPTEQQLALPLRKSTVPRSIRWRKLQASWRNTWLILREFGWPLLIFSVAILGGGTFYYIFSINAGEPLDNLLEAYYQVLSLTFFQSIGEFPRAWYLEIFYFIMPVIGVIILAQGVTEIGVMLFNRRAHSKEREMAIASTMNHHVVLVGLGHLGYRVAKDLYELGQEVAVVELNPNAELAASVKDLGIPVIQEDATREAALNAAGVRKANSIILCTQNDSLNLKVALKARRLNPSIQVVLRIFDDDFAQALQEQFGFTAFSATGMAAPAFAAAAAGVDMTRPITVEGEILSLARLKISPSSKLTGMSIHEIEQDYNLSVVLVRNNNNSDLHPDSQRRVIIGDALAVLGGQREISRLAQQNHS